MVIHFDTYMSFQISAMLTDGGSTSRNSAVNATITVNVIRNDYTPQFVGAPYSGSLDQNTQQQPNFVIFQVTATDEDPSVSSPFMSSLMYIYFVGIQFFVTGIFIALMNSFLKM